MHGALGMVANCFTLCLGNPFKGTFAGFTDIRSVSIHNWLNIARAVATTTTAAKESGANGT